MTKFVRALVVLAFALAGCGPPSRPVEQPKPDPTGEAWYGETIQELATMTRQAEALFQSGKFDAAGATVTKAQPLENRLLAAPRPTLPAMEAASDLDDLYGRMLLRNRQYGWARDFFQKNVVRWKAWKPQTPGTEGRWKQAVAQVAECDRGLAQ
jgi:hypothetical protein